MERDYVFGALVPQKECAQERDEGTGTEPAALLQAHASTRISSMTAWRYNKSDSTRTLPLNDAVSSNLARVISPRRDDRKRVEPAGSQLGMDVHMNGYGTCLIAKNGRHSDCQAIRRSGKKWLGARGKIRQRSSPGARNSVWQTRYKVREVLRTPRGRWNSSHDARKQNARQARKGHTPARQSGRIKATPCAAYGGNSTQGKREERQGHRSEDHTWSL